MSGRKEEEYDYLEHSRAATEMTGLIPAGIESDAEKESYQNVFPYPAHPSKKEENRP